MRALLTKPILPFTLSVRLPGCASSASLAPPTIIARALPQPSFVKIQSMLSLDTSTEPMKIINSRKNNHTLNFNVGHFPFVIFSFVLKKKKVFIIIYVLDEKLYIIITYKKNFPNHISCY